MSGGNAVPALDVEGLVAAYEADLPIVRGVDLRVRRGELVTLLGPNGAGKSTLVKAIAGTAPILAGTVRLDGTPIEALPVHEKLARGLGFVPQTENIFASLSIEDETREPGRLPMRTFQLYATPTVEILREDAPRFSSKRLDHLARQARARVEELLAAGDPDVTALFTALFTAEGEPC